MGRKWWIVVGLAVAAFFWTTADAKQEQENPAPAFPVQTQQTDTQEQTPLEFPAVVRGTGLILQQIARYEGPFLEDDVQEPVCDVMALMVYNPGSQWVCWAQLELQQGERTLVFEIMLLPPGSRVLVLERSGQSYSAQPLSSCRCLSLEMAESVESDNVIAQETNGHLEVVNLTQEQVNNVTLYYRQYRPEDGFYLGGRADTCTIETLLPGQCREVVPYRYVAGSCRVVAAVVE